MGLLRRAAVGTLGWLALALALGCQVQPRDKGTDREEEPSDTPNGASQADDDDDDDADDQDAASSSKTPSEMKPGAPSNVIPVHFFYAGDASSGMDRDVPRVAVSPGVEELLLLDRVVSYRNDRIATVRLTLPEPDTIEDAELIVKAYNDDAGYQRALRLEIEGDGAYLGTYGIGDLEVEGAGVLPAKGTMDWTYRASQVQLGYTLGEGRGSGETRSLLELLQGPGRRKIALWVSTYGTLGPKSWVSLRLRLYRRSRGAE